MKTLILGDGLLGKSLQQITGWDYISRKKDGIDFNNPQTYLGLLDPIYDTIVNCIGYTKTYDADREKHWNTNYAAVSELVDYCFNYSRKLVHISTDYVYANSISVAQETDVPAHCANWYGYTKLLADGYVQLKLINYLLIRTSFKPEPFPYEEAIIQHGNFDYVSKISGLIKMLIENNARGVFNVGTEIKMMYDLAFQTHPEIGITDRLIHDTMPRDITMDVSKMNQFFKQSNVNKKCN